jgi:hypothetical protein
MTFAAGLGVVEGPESIGSDVLDLLERFLVRLAPVRIGKSVALVVESGDCFRGLRGRWSADASPQEGGSSDQK